MVNRETTTRNDGRGRVEKRMQIEPTPGGLTASRPRGEARPARTRGVPQRAGRAARARRGRTLYAFNASAPFLKRSASSSDAISERTAAPLGAASRFDPAACIVPAGPSAAFPPACAAGQFRRGARPIPKHSLSHHMCCRAAMLSRTLSGSAAADEYKRVSRGQGGASPPAPRHTRVWFSARPAEFAAHRWPPSSGRVKILCGRCDNNAMNEVSRVLQWARERISCISGNG